MADLREGLPSGSYKKPLKIEISKNKILSIAWAYQASLRCVILWMSLFIWTMNYIGSAQAPIEIKIVIAYNNVLCFQVHFRRLSHFMDVLIWPNEKPWHCSIKHKLRKR